MNYFRFFFLGSIFILFFSCGQSGKKENKTSEKIIGREYTGEVTEEDLIHSPYTNSWFTSGKENYQTHQPSLEIIKENIHNFKLEVFMGTWCPDSQAEMPRFFKILEEVNFDKDNLVVYALDENKTSKEKFEKGKNITNVPTIIFYKDGKEVNRFVEYPRESLARDMAKIVSGQPYKHIYK